MIPQTEELLLNADIFFVPEGEIAGGSKATGTLTLGANVAADETVTIGPVTYTYKAAPTTGANEVKVGADASASLDNLIAAIGQTAGAGDKYGSATVLHPSCKAAAGAGDTMVVTALTAGTAGNSLATTETLAGGGNEFGAATLLGGVSGDVIGIDTQPVDFSEFEFGNINQVVPKREVKTEQREAGRGSQGGYRIKNRSWVTQDMYEFTTLEFNAYHHRLNYGLSADPTPGVEQTPFDKTFRELYGWFKATKYKEDGAELCTLVVWGVLRLPSVPEIKNETASPVWELEILGSGSNELDSIKFAS